ncbi:MAG: NADH-quinone oxidoreductase subunit C [Nitriliruptoraceae bacterium]
MTEVLARRDEALSADEIAALLRDRFAEGIVDAAVEFETFTVTVTTPVWADVARMCRDESALAFDMFDCLFGVDAREEGFDVVAVIYSTSTGNRLALRARCDGGRDAPSCPSITDVYRGADWMERETWDMFGIDFPGHPGLEPRLLTVENFEGFPLRKDFHLTARVAKPWPGVKEPVELDEDGNVIERVTGIGDAPGPYDLDKALAEQAKAVNAPVGAVTEDASADDDASEADDASDDAEGTETDDATVEPADSDGPSAQEKAEARRREQAEARRRKAEERAASEEPDGDGEGDA